VQSICYLGEYNTASTAPPLTYVNYRATLPDHEFENVNTPVIYPQGKQVLDIDLQSLMKFKIPIGKRNSTLGALTMQLIEKNRTATRKQLLNASLYLNKYCTMEP
jgi:hypothetical protein